MASSKRNVHVEEDLVERSNEQWDYEFNVKNQNFCAMCIVDPEDSSKPCAVKIFGCYPTEKLANLAAKEISAECDFFHVYVCSTNAWVPVPPKAEFIENVEYQESRMKEIQETFTAIKERQAKDVIRKLQKESAIVEQLESENVEEK